MSSPYRFRVAILDVDGTLVDSNDAHAFAWVDALREHGLHEAPEASFDNIRKLIGMGGDKLLPRVAHISEDSPLGSKIADRRAAIFRDRYLPGLRPFPDVRALMLRMREAGMKLVVASSARAEELAPLLRIAGVDDLIEKRTSSDDADSSKPDPDIITAALKRVSALPADAVMLGDTPYDVEAAKSAGVPTIALRSGGWDSRGLADAIAIYDDTGDLLRKFDASPLGQLGQGASAVTTAR